jgi:hypothetical protein
MWIERPERNRRGAASAWPQACNLSAVLFCLGGLLTQKVAQTKEMKGVND